MKWFHKKTPVEQFMQDTKNQFLQNLVNQLMGGLNFQFDFFSDGNSPTASILNGMKVPLVKEDPKEGEQESNREYTTCMSILNGDRDQCYPNPEKIEIKAFENDSLSEEERSQIYDIIDCVNEANDINRDGIYRGDDPQSEEKSEKTEEKKDKTKVIQNIVNGLIQLLTPILNLVMSCVGMMVSLVIVSRMVKVIQSF